MAASRQRQSEVCCLVLCDLVRACVLTNVVFMIVIVFYIWVSFDNDLAAKFGVVPLVVEQVDDDGNVVDEGLDPWTVLGYIKIVFGFVFCSVGILGALRFQKWLVLSGAIYYLVYALLTFADRKNGRWVGAFLSLIFSYPSFHLFAALRNESITPDNYDREKYCCCLDHREKHGCCCGGTAAEP